MKLKLEEVTGDPSTSCNLFVVPKPRRTPVVGTHTRQHARPWN